MDTDTIYKYDEPLHPEADKLILVRRWEQLNEVINDIRKGKFWAIYGPRKIGKTTFLKQIYGELCGAFFCIHIDFTASPKDTTAFYTWLMEQILNSVPAKLADGFTAKIPSGRNPENHFFQFLKCLTLDNNAQINNIIFLFDEIEKVDSIDSFLKGLRMVHEGRKTDNALKKYQSVVITGSMNLLKLSGGKVSPFNIAKQLYLEDFSREETWQFIDRSFVNLEEKIRAQTKKGDLIIKVEEGAKEKLFHHLSGHPQMLQHALHILAQKAEEERRSINKEDIEFVIDEIYRENSSLKILKRQIRNDEKLQNLIIDILQEKRIPFYSFEEYAIKGAGAIKEDKDRNCVIRNLVFKEYLTSLRLSKSLYLDTVEELMRSTVTAENFEDLSQKIVDKCADFLNTEICTLWRKVNEDGQDKLILAACKGFTRSPGDPVPSYYLNWNAQKDDEIEGLTAWIAIRNQYTRFNSHSELKAHHSYKGYLDQLVWTGKANQKFKCLIGVPLQVENEVVGVLKWENSENPEGFSDEDFEMAKKMAPFIAITLESMNFRENAIQNRQRYLRQLTESLLNTAQEELNQQIVDTTAQLLNADFCSLWLCDHDKKELRLAAEYGVKSEKAKTSSYQLNWNPKEDSDIESITAWVAIRCKSFYARDFEEIENHKSWKGSWNRDHWGEEPKKSFSSYYAVPLAIKNEIFGVLKIKRKLPKPPFSDVDRAVFVLMANFIVLSLELNSRLRQDVIFDFFHLLKQPTSNAIMVFNDLNKEFNRPQGQRPERINKRLMQLARNLESIRGWTYNVYSLATARVTGQHEKRKDAPFQELINDTIDELKRAFPDIKCNVSIETKFYSLLLTELEQKKFHVILYHILFNGIKYSSDNPMIEINVAITGNHVLALSIKDNGQGIIQEDLPYIFNPHFTRGAKNWPESMGLGLTTVARLLEEFGFDKRVKSDIGKGTEFTILIPAGRWRKNE
jgi:GAF domain-containing protein/two-component sensor histidine kinase